MMLVSGCANDRVISGSAQAVYDNLDPLVNAHVDALIEDGGPQSLVTGKILVEAWDAGRPQ